MKISFFYLLLLIISADNLYGQHMDKVRDYLTTNYPKRDTIYTKDLVYDNYLIGQVMTPILTKKTGTVIYTTELMTGYYEYNLVKIAVLVTANNKIEIITSPTFSKTNENFLKLLQGVCTDKEEEKTELTKEISEVFKEITYEGEIVNIHPTDKGTTCDLKHGRLYWRKLTFNFTDNCLTSIDVQKPDGFKN